MGAPSESVGMRLAAATDDPEAVLSSFAAVHGIGAFAFGTGLVVSDLLGRDSQSPAYAYVQAVPGWPWLIGVTFIACGLLIMWARIKPKDDHLVAATAFFVLTAATAVYGMLFALGTAVSGSSLIGPQFLYFTMAALYGLHSLTSWSLFLTRRADGVDH